MSIIISKLVPVPSYLSCFENEFHEIRLIYAKKPSIASADDDKCSPIKNEPIHENSTEEEEEEECDLTGDPLKVDLGGDDTIEINNMEQDAPIWSNEETKHFPLTVDEGRRELNRILKNLKPEPNSPPIYVVCNGDDPRNTVFLGGERKSLMACAVYVLGYIELKDDEIQTGEMVNDHFTSCNRKDIEVKYLVKIKYNVYGKPLRYLPCQNASMRDLEKHASVSIDVTSHQCVFNVLEDTKVSMTMNLELVAGHKLLRLHSLWKELHTLQTFIDILSNGLDEDTILCDDPLDVDIILHSISVIVNTKFLRPPPKKDVIDLDNLRQEDFLDGLWNILKQCETVCVLRNSLSFLLEELVNTNIRVINIKDKYSRIASIINGILNKNIVLPDITLPLCVELLFELGAQKLKFDFQVILDHFNHMAKNNIESVWKNFFQTKEPTSRATVGAIRLTHHKNDSNLVSKTKQMAYLCQLYVAAEFIFLVKEQVFLHADNFYSFCQHIEKQYVDNCNLFEDFLDVYRSPLCETSFALDLANLEAIKSVFPSRWTMHMTSEVGTMLVTTTYDLSKQPIFPPAIYNYDVPIANKNMVYFMSKMTHRKDLFDYEFHSYYLQD